ncbi:P-type conjugative transfer protein VirB9 [Marinobacterium nitratireducens]|uniref:P-type conjugative transfer protein VirB9 n=2 Tax=Marinobacterium nitratireducens TaxID=518897 RepID=A0A918DVR0_9GAMM|nr:P-type conjugative transfer protein VirB9 [Marinobacterium nitratireducens]
MVCKRQLSGIVLLVCLSITGSAGALETPRGGPYDSRVKFINYNAAEVVKVVGHYGFSTHIQFGPTEEVQQIAMGDKDAWEIAPVANHIFIKPKGEKAVTNMTVITTRRVYNFELSAHWSRNGAHPHPNDMFFQINFHYPEEEAARIAAEAEAKRLQKRLNRSSDPVPVNWNYWAKGAADVTPDKAFDDRRFTYLTFANNSEMPAIYIVNPDGSESLVNTHIDPESPDTIVVHRVARQFVMRKGSSVACVFNKTYDPNGVTNETGTTTPGIQRVIKGSR